MLCCHSNKTYALTVNLPNSAQLEGTSAIPRSYIRVRAVMAGKIHARSDLDIDLLA